MGNRRHKKASKSVLERSTVETVEKKSEDSINKVLTKIPSNSNDEDTTGDTAEVSEKTNSKSDVSAATKEVTEDDDNYLPNEPDKSCVNKNKAIDQESVGVELAKNINGSIILDEIDDESKENELDNVKNIENKTKGDTEIIQQVPVLRLVAIEKLLKPDFMKEEETLKASTSSKSNTLTKLSKTSSRSRKNISYVEISDSSENETVESINSSSENEENSKKLPLASRKSGDIGIKENISTNKILSDGKSKHDFNNPSIISPSKAKMVKSFTLNIEKMPTNVNKLMKVYKVNDQKNHDELASPEPIDIWSESDDFENMISTSKIEKKSSDPEKSSKTNGNSEKEKSTRATRLNKASYNEEMLIESNKNKKPNCKSSLKISHKTKNDDLEVTRRTTRNSEKRAFNSTSRRINTKEDAAEEKSTTVIDNNTSKMSIKNPQNKIIDEPIASNSNLKKSVNKDEDDDNIAIEIESIVSESRNKNRSPQKKFSNDREDSDHSSSSNENVQKTKEVPNNMSSTSADEEISEDEPSPILETRMRSREKYEKHADFISLKQTISLRKKKKLDEMEPKVNSKSIQSTDNASKFKIPLKTKSNLIASNVNNHETTPKTEITEITQTNSKKNTVVNNPSADVKKEQNAIDNDSIVNPKFKKS